MPPIGKVAVVLWATGIALALVGELLAVFDGVHHNTITQQTFRSPISMGLMCSLLFWAVYHFIFARGKTDWIDGFVAALGALAGVFTWVRLRKKKKEEE